MTDHNRHRIHAALHLAAILTESAGAWLIFKEASRFDRMVKILGYASFDGEPEALKVWYYHSGHYGFYLIFVGIVLQAIAFAITDARHLRAQHDPEKPNPPSRPVASAHRGSQARR